MNNYRVNFRRLAVALLPTFLRKRIMTLLTCAVLTPICYLYVRFLGYRNDTIYRLGHNGQVCYLCAVLNDEFDPEERRITVTDPEKRESMLVYERETEREILIPGRGTAILPVNCRGFEGTSGIDFFVNIPYVLSRNIDLPRLKAIVTVYKLASKRYVINFK